MAVELSGIRVLVVEDEALIAAMLEEMLLALGAVVVGPVPTLAEGMRAAASAEFDIAILDVNLRGERVDPLAEALRARQVPLVFATGYGRGSEPVIRGSPVIDKPYTERRLHHALGRALDPQPSRRQA